MELDLKGMYCPIPVLRAREAIVNLSLGDTLVVIADDPAAEEDMRRWAKRAGHEVVSLTRTGDEITIKIRRLK